MKIETLPEEVTAIAKSSIISLLLVLNLDVSQIGFLLCTVFIDSFFGVIKSIRLGSHFQVGKFIWGISKKLAILFIPFFLAWFGLLFKVNLIYIVQAFIYLIAANDLISIISNIASIYSGKSYQTVDFIEKGIHLLINWLTAFANGIMTKVNVIISALKKDEDSQNPDQHQGE